MPTAAPRRCGVLSHPPFTTRKCRLCEAAYRRERGTATQRGYDKEWRAFRAAFLARYPICCRPGCGERATDVDHIVQLKDGGAKLDPANCQPFCHRHHSEETRNDQLNAHAGKLYVW
jgi:5-methylcytosine-specific restriction enzyme A